MYVYMYVCMYIYIFSNYLISSIISVMYVLLHSVPVLFCRDDAIGIPAILFAFFILD